MAEKGQIMIKYMIASDIHGSAYYCRKMLEAYDREGADRLWILGDILYHGPRNELPEGYAPKEVIAMLNERKADLLCVRGNCDTEVDQMVLEFPVLAEYAILETGGQTVYITHGHKQNPKNPPLLKAGDILLNGHTHVPACEKFTADNGAECMYLNPGSVSIPKENSAHSYMVIERPEAGVPGTGENRSEISFQWKNLEGEVYQTWKTDLHC